MPGIRGGQIRDETIESVDIASGSIKMGEAAQQVRVKGVGRSLAVRQVLCPHAADAGPQQQGVALFLALDVYAVQQAEQ